MSAFDCSLTVFSVEHLYCSSSCRLDHLLRNPNASLGNHCVAVGWVSPTWNLLPGFYSSTFCEQRAEATLNGVHSSLVVPAEAVVSEDLDFDAFAAVSMGLDRKLGAGSAGVPPLPEWQRGAEVTDVRGNKTYVCYCSTCKKLIPMGGMQ